MGEVRAAALSNIDPAQPDRTRSSNRRIRTARRTRQSRAMPLEYAAFTRASPVVEQATVLAQIFVRSTQRRSPSSIAIFDRLQNTPPPLAGGGSAAAREAGCLALGRSEIGR